MDTDEKQDHEYERLAQFHHTISEQLNARLAESPKFFGLLIVVSTGYGYVLSTPHLSEQAEVFVLASFLSYATVLWSIWYLAALGYAFRFLQNSQHLIERALGWSPAYVPGPEDGRMSGEPPEPIKILKSFWLLPGIYHAHAAGLSVFLLIICGAFWFRAGQRWPFHWLAPVISLIAVSLGLFWIFWINRYYLKKFKRKRRNPQQPSEGGPQGTPQQGSQVE
jgi:hypothetical protein